MNWMLPAIIIVVFIGLLILKNTGLIPAQKAKEFLASGCKVIDVRTEGEYKKDAIQGVVNIPLDSIPNEVNRVIPDKNTVILLHCLSGTRSGIAAGRLKRAGYTQVYNLGSYSRAKKILSER